MERLRNGGGSVTIPCKGSLIIPSGAIDTLPLVNEFNLDPRRLTNAQCPLGGVNGLVDYAPGSVHVTDGDGIYLTDVAGNNTSKDLPAGLLSRLGYLTVDTVAHMITEEFMVANTATSNNPSTVNNCTSLTGVSGYDSSASQTRTLENDGIKTVGTAAANGSMTISINCTVLSSDKFIVFKIISPYTCQLKSVLSNSGITETLQWLGSRFQITANIETIFVLPLLTSIGTIGLQCSTKTSNFSASIVTKIIIGVAGFTSGATSEFTIRSITSDVAKPAYIETAVPDNITSVVYHNWTGSAYEINCIANMDSVYSVTFLDSTKIILNDGTKFNDVYGSGNGRSRFVKGASGQTVNGSLAGTQMTYSANKGTKNRIGFRVDLPPSDGGRTAFNQCRIKKIIYYDDVNKAYNVLPDISGNGNNGTMSQVGLTTDNLGNPYGAMSFNGVNSYVDCGNGGSLNITQGLTIVMWVKQNDTSTKALISKDYNTAYELAIVGNVLKGYISNTSLIVGTTPVGTDVYKRVVFTYQYVGGSNNIQCLYLNGSPEANNTSSAVIGTNVLHVLIGIRTGNTLPMNGLLADVRIYNRAWSPAEVTADYNNQPVDPTGLVAQWQPSTVSHMGQSTQEFSNDNNASTGLLNIAKPWLAIIDPTTKKIDYYIFTERPTSLSYKRDEAGNVYEVIVNPGNGLVYKGSTVWANDTLETKSAVLSDISGNGNNGTMFNVGLTADNAGNPYGAMSFNGVNSYVDCGTNSNLHFSNSFTISAMVKISSAPSDNYCFIVSDYFGTYKGYAFFLTTGRQVRLQVGRQSTSSAASATSSQILSLDTYYTITGIYDGIKPCVYVNAAVTNGANYNPIEAEIGNMYIGKARWTNPLFKGVLSDVRLYNRALSPEEVTALQNNQPVDPTGLVAQWQPSSDSKPDMLDSTIQNSIANMLSVHAFNR